MADQDAQDINQMMSASPEVAVKAPRKSMFAWIVLGCVIMGVGLGVVVYQQSLAPAVKPSPTPKAIVPTPTPTPIPSPVLPQTNTVTPVANTMTFPQTGKIRVFSDLNNLTLVITITTGGVTKTLTLPNRATNTTTPMNFSDSSFEVTAGSVGTIEAYLNSTSDVKMGGWILPTDGTKCGANGFGIVDNATKITFAETKLTSGQTIFAKQCWADQINPADPSSYDFNDFFLAWSYATGSTLASPSPSASASPAASPSPSASSSPSPSPSLSPSPSPSVAASPSPSAAAVVSPSPSARAAMPDTTDGVPVTGIFEVTVGTVSVGLILLVLGLFGLLAL